MGHCRPPSKTWLPCLLPPLLVPSGAKAGPCLCESHLDPSLHVPETSALNQRWELCLGAQHPEC